MTLRDALTTVDLNKVYKIINKKDCQTLKKKISLSTTVKMYKVVVKELLNNPQVKPYKMSWIIKEEIDVLDKKKYISVCFLNHNYIKPPDGLKPWGVVGRRKIPKGCYNINDDKYNKYFAIGFTPRRKTIDTPIINETKYSLEKIIAELLWEITFYGWTEKDVNKQFFDIKKSILISKKEVKEGKCITIPPVKKDGYKIVIPNSVVKQLNNIFNKNT